MGGSIEYRRPNYLTNDVVGYRTFLIISFGKEKENELAPILSRKYRISIFCTPPAQPALISKQCLASACILKMKWQVCWCPNRNGLRVKFGPGKLFLQPPRVCGWASELLSSTGQNISSFIKFDFGHFTRKQHFSEYDDVLLFVTSTK